VQKARQKLQPTTPTHASREQHRTSGSSARQALLVEGYAGNQATLRRLSRTPPHLQCKLEIGAVNDPLEAEADRVADQVMRMPDPSVSIATAPPQVSRKCAGCEEEDKKLQAKSAEAPLPGEAPPIVHDVLRSPGQPLDAATRAFMEPRFGHDFSRVRVHADARAAKSAESVNARAYTVGQDIVLGNNQDFDGSLTGRSLLAHELTHVLQQSGPDTTPAEDNPPSSRMRLAPCHRAAPTVMREIISANPSPSGGGGHPPDGLSGCTVFLGGRTIDHWLAGTLGFRHLYIDCYEGPTSYSLIEGGPVGSTTTGTSGAWVKNMDWDARGIQWNITPPDCPNFIPCLKSKTADYNGASYPYHYSNGPNSNSFAWWVLNECGVTITPLVASYPYRGVDYWTSHPAPAPVPSAAPVPATP